MKQRMPYAEFIQWLAVYRLSPFGDERADLRAGIVASTVANCHAKTPTAVTTAHPLNARSPVLVVICNP